MLAAIIDVPKVDRLRARPRVNSQQVSGSWAHNFLEFADVIKHKCDRKFLVRCEGNEFVGKTLATASWRTFQLPSLPRFLTIRKSRLGLDETQQKLPQNIRGNFAVQEVFSTNTCGRRFLSRIVC